MTQVPETQRPFQVYAVLNGTETFHSGHMTEEEAIATMEKANKEAKNLDIRSRYIVKRP